jgi:two-component system CheB/CheR fusion protein
MIEQYFVRQGDGLAVRKDVRDCIVFARHDVTRDTPFVRIDLISCRNLLIYFDADLQRDVLRAFHFALVPDGVLVLGKSENAGQTPPLFSPLFSEARIFRRNPAAQSGGGRPILLRQSPVPKPAHRTEVRRTIRDALTEHLKPRALLLGPSGEIRETEGNLDDFITMPSGKAELNATKLLRPELRGELWALLARVKKQNTAVAGTQKVVDGARKHHVRLTLAPAGPAADPAYLLVIDELTEPAPIASGDHEHVAYLQHELTATREHLQSVIEELEVSNEELQALNEELQASNEELHATSEETETANEELQAANEELTTLNDELRARTNELQAVNEDLENIQRSIGYSLVILDRKLRIKRYSAECVRYFGITAADIGEPMTSIPAHVQIDGLFDKLTETIEKGRPHAIEAVTDKASLSIRIRPFLNTNNEVDGALIVVLDETLYREALRRLAASEERFALAVRGSLDGIWDQPDLSANDGYWSPRLREVLGASDRDTTSFQALQERVHPDDVAAFNAALHGHLNARHAFDIECRLKLGAGAAASINGNGKRNGSSGLTGYGWFHIRGQAIWDEMGQPVRMAGSVSDIGSRKAGETRIRSLNEQLLRARPRRRAGHLVR